MDMGEIMKLNWNRMSMLSKIKNRNDTLEIEYRMRIAFQNEFANSQTEIEKEEITNSVLETLDKEMIKKINNYKSLK